jgi:FkbM family methyltransferase
MSNNRDSLLDLFLKRKNGDLPREEYWRKIQDSLFFLENLQQLLILHHVSVLIRSEGILCEIDLNQYLNERPSNTPPLLLVLNPNDIRSVPFSVIADGKYENFQSTLLLELGQKSTHFVDVGSNIGFYALALALSSNSVKISAVEPNLEVFACLKQNTELNYLTERVRIFNIGLGMEKGKATLYVPAFTGTGGGSLRNLHPDEGVASEQQITIKTFDEVFRSEFVDFVKIDVEGFELSVLNGALTIISRDKPSIMIELLRKWMAPFGNSPQDALLLLQELGYDSYSITSQGLREINEINDNTVENNFLFVHSSNTNHRAIARSYLKK